MIKNYHCIYLNKNTILKLISIRIYELKVVKHKCIFKISYKILYKG